MSEFNEDLLEHEGNLATNQSTRQINGKPMYYTTSQVASQIDETDSTVRYYCLKFKDVLHIETKGTHRRFTEENIEQLKYIKKLLKEDNMTIKQATEFLSEKDPAEIERRVGNSDPIAVQAIASAISLQVKDVIKEALSEFEANQEREMIENFRLFAGAVLESQEKELGKIIDKIDSSTEERIKSVEEIFKNFKTGIKESNELQDKRVMENQERLEKEIRELKQQLEDSKEEDRRKAEERDRQLTELLKQSLENKESESKKGFFSRMFGK